MSWFLDLTRDSRSPRGTTSRQPRFLSFGVKAFSALADRCDGHDTLGHVSGDSPRLFDQHESQTRRTAQNTRRIAHVPHGEVCPLPKRETLPYRAQVHLPRKYWRSSCRGTWTPNLSSWALYCIAHQRDTGARITWRLQRVGIPDPGKRVRKLAVGVHLGT